MHRNLFNMSEAKICWWDKKKTLHFFFYFRWLFLPFRNQMECWELEKYWFTDSCWKEQPGLERLCLFPLLLDELFLFVFHELLKIQTAIFKHLIMHLLFYFLLVQCRGARSELSHHMFISSLKCLQGKINWCLQIGWKIILALLPSDSALQILSSYFCILNVTTCELHINPVNLPMTSLYPAGSLPQSCSM